MEGSPMDMKESITRALMEAFSPSALDVIDESDQHAGHGGWREGQTTHVRIRIASAAFAGMTRVAMHRDINAALKPAFDAGLHALAIEAKAG
jgi:BolA family transcriptional regulator, general stress-responsive regulator